MGLIADIHDDIEKGAVRLITEYRARLFSDAVRLCGNANDAEDLVNRTFLKVINRLDQHNPGKNFYGWMKTILVNLHRDDLDRPVTRGTVPVEDSILAQHAGADWSTDEQILKNSDGEAVREALRHIDPEFRQLVLLRYYDEFSLKEIASILNKPIGTVSRRIQIALRLLAGKLEAEFGNSKPKLAAFAAIILSFVSFAAWQTAEAVRSHFSEEPVAAESALGSLGLEGTFWASADAAVFADANTLSTTENIQEEETMNLKSITQTAAKLAVGTALTSGFSARADVCPAAFYVQSGLCAQWDAIENAGVGVHSSETTTWVDLTGGGLDWKLGANGWNWSDDALVLSGTATVGTMLNGQGASALYGKLSTVEFVYANGESKDGILFCPGFGATAYLYTDPQGRVGFWGARSGTKYGSAVVRGETNSFSVVYARTGDTPTGVTSFSVNGVEKTNDGMGDWWESGMYSLYLGGRGTGSQYAKGSLCAVRIYDRVLTDAERARNWQLDRVRFLGAADPGIKSFTVDEIPVQYVSPGSAATPTVVVSDAMTGAPVPTDLYEVVYADNEAEGEASATVIGKEGTDYAGQSVRKAFRVILASYRDLTVIYPTNIVNVVIDGADAKDGKYMTGSEVTLAASSPLGCEFVRWYGNVEGVDVEQPSITLTINSDLVLLPYFKTPWTYLSGKISDGYWTVPVTASGKDLTTKTGTALISTLLPILDFDKPMADEYRLVALGTDTFWGSQVYKATLTELRFPDSLTSFGYDSCNGCSKVQNVRIGPNVTSVGTRAFYGCSSLRGFNGTDDVILDGLTQIANAAFSGCSALCGRVVIGGEATCNYVSGNTSAGVFEGCSGVTDVKVGDGVTGLGPYPFASCSSLTNFVLGAGLVSISDRFFMSCAKLKTVEIGGFPVDNHSRCFNNFPSAYGTLFIVPADSADWQGFVATHVTPWKNLDATVKAKFAIPGWRKPYGLITTASSDEGLYYPVNHWIAYKPTVGMMIMIR